MRASKNRWEMASEYKRLSDVQRDTMQEIVNQDIKRITTCKNPPTSEREANAEAEILKLHAFWMQLTLFTDQRWILQPLVLLQRMRIRKNISEPCGGDSGQAGPSPVAVVATEAGPPVLLPLLLLPPRQQLLHLRLLHEIRFTKISVYSRPQSAAVQPLVFAKAAAPPVLGAGL